MEGKADSVRVLIAAGGTGGHVFPGVAIAEEIRRAHPEAAVLFAGTGRGLEASVLPKLGWPLVLLDSTSIKDRRGWARFSAWLGLPRSLLQAMGALRRERPKIIVSIGGYAAGPLALAGWLRGIPFVIVEPNAVAGFTHRLLGKLARRAFVAFEEARAAFPPGRAVVSGNPVRREVQSVRREGAPAAPGEKQTLFIFGGSQGARRLNRAAVAALPLLGGLRQRLRVMHQTGEHDDGAAIAKAYRENGVEATVLPFLERIWEWYRGADLVLARAGATSIAELAVLAIPSILVPYPHAADDHQRANALGLVRRGGAVMVEDAELTGERLAAELDGLLGDPARLAAMRRALAVAVRPDAARVIVEESWKFVKP